jgi:putative sporulation protein YyaC
VHILLPGVCIVRKLFTIDSISEDASDRIALAILALISDIPGSKHLTVVCVGTDRSTGDSLGPLVGTFLSCNGYQGKVLGTLDHPVHAANIQETLSAIEAGEIVLGIDACLGVKKEIGSIIVRRGSLKPGLGVNKKLPEVGDLHIAGVVNVGGFMEYMVLQNTRLNLVIRMAQEIARGILKAGSYLYRLYPGNLPGSNYENDITHEGRDSAGLHLQFLQVYDPRHQ